MYVVNNKIKFNPRRIPGLILWLNSDVGITLNGGAVSNWADQSGNKNDLVQGTGANQPSFQRNVINGHPVLRFDGTNSFMDLADNATLHNQNGSLFVVLKTTGSVTCMLAGEGDLNTDRNGILLWLQNGASPIGELADASSFRQTTVFTPSVNDGLPRLLNFVFDSSNMIVYSNGFLGVILARLSQAVAWSTNPFRVGRTPNNTNRNYNGDIAEILFFSSDLSTPDRRSVEDYLNRKYRMW